LLRGYFFHTQKIQFVFIRFESADVKQKTSVLQQMSCPLFVRDGNLPVE